MTVRIHADVEQGSEDWHRLRLGRLTASEVKFIMTPSLKIANNDKVRVHVYELAAQRITNWVEPHYVSDDMLRGHTDEVLARDEYAKHYAPVTECGFITNDKFGFTIGYSPDALVGDDGLIECKSRRAKYQVQTIIGGEPPEDYVLQLQTGLLVSEREWVDFVSYSGGLPMMTERVFPDLEMQAAIVEAATAFEQRVADVVSDYHAAIASLPRLIPTERVVLQEMF